MSIGNVITGDKDGFTDYARSGRIKGMDVYTSNDKGQLNTVMDHELGHTPQSMSLGASYIPAVLLTYGVSGAWSFLQGNGLDTHSHSIFENDSGFNSVPDY